MLDILGRMKQFERMEELAENMPTVERRNIVNERTFSILLSRYASGHKVQKAIDMFYRREEFGLKLDSVAFQTLLLSLCRYKHVDITESLFLEKKREFPLDIKAMNIILNAGKLGTAVKLFASMWKKGCHPDVAICNCVIDALCFKKRIPDALNIFGEMNEKCCEPDVVTHNTLIKHLCKIQRMDEAYKLLGDMEGKGCQPNGRTYIYFLKSMKTPEEADRMLHQMEKFGCKFTSDVYNSILNLFTSWNFEEGIKVVWNKMAKDGVCPDQRSHTIMIHGLYEREKRDEALHYFGQMISKGMIPQPRAHLLVQAMKMRETDDARLA